MNDIKQQVEDSIRTKLIPQCYKAYDQYLDNIHFNSELAHKYLNYDLGLEIAQNQAKLATDEFIKMYPDVTEEDLVDKVDEYINRFYTQDFLINQLRFMVDEHQLVVQMQAQLICNTMRATHTSNDKYWLQKVVLIDSISKLADYLKDKSMVKFIAEKAPNWQMDLLSTVVQADMAAHISQRANYAIYQMYKQMGVDTDIHMSFDKAMREAQIHLPQFIASNPDLTESNMASKVEQFVNQTYPHEKALELAKSEVNEEDVRTQLENSLVYALISHQPYSSQGDGSYWYPIVHQIKDLKELSDYVVNQNFADFRNKYTR